LSAEDQIKKNSVNLFGKTMKYALSGGLRCLE